MANRNMSNITYVAVNISRLTSRSSEYFAKGNCYAEMMFLPLFFFIIADILIILISFQLIYIGAGAGFAAKSSLHFIETRCIA